MKKIIATLIGFFLLGLCSQPVKAIIFKGGPSEEIVGNFLDGINHAPKISIAQSTVYVDEGGYITVLIRVTDPDGDAVNFTATSATLPTELTEVADGVYQFHWTPRYDQAGTHVLNLRAEDVKGASAIALLTIVVGDVSRGINITGFYPPTPVNLNEGDSEIFSVQATSLDGKNLTYFWSVDGMMVSASLFLGLYFDYNDAGNHVIKVEITDGSDTVSQEWQVKVTDVNLAPTIEIISITGGSVGKLLTIKIGGTDLDGDALTFGHDGPGALVGTIWSHTPVDTGELTVTFTVTDGRGGSDSATIAVNVTAADTNDTNIATIKLESGSIMIHDSIVPQSSDPLIITTDQNGWGKSPVAGDWFSKTGDWWTAATDRVPVVSGLARFNAIRGAEWVNPQSPAIICGAGIEKYDNKDGTWCFTLLK